MVKNHKTFIYLLLTTEQNIFENRNDLIFFVLKHKSDDYKTATYILSGAD